MVTDELSATPMRMPHPMRIKLAENVNPKKVTTARWVPLRFSKPAMDVIKDLIAKKVITAVDTPTEWCSPAFFVPKPMEKSD